MQRIALALSRTAVVRGVGVSARATQHQVSSMVTASSSGSKVQRAMYSTGSILFSGEDGEDKQHKPLSADELVPDDFFDFDVESSQEFLDVASAMASGEKFDEHCEEMLSTGLETLTTSKQGMSMDEVLKQDAIQKESYDRPQAPSGGETTLPLAEEGTFKETGDIHSRILAHSKEGGPSTADQLASHFGIVGKFNQTELVNTYLLGAEDLNTTMPRNFLQSKEDEEFQSQFLPQTSSELQRPYLPGRRHCEGKKQRSGVRGQLDCHLIDLDTLSPFDVMNLRRFISLDSEIMGRRATGLCAKCQRKVAKTIKQSRNLGFLAHIDEFVVKDQRPHMEENFHGSVEGEEAFVSKTVGWRK